MSAVKYVIDRIVVDVATAAYDCTIKGVENVQLSRNFTGDLHAGGSELDPTLRSVPHVENVVRATTRDVGTLLAACYANSNTIPHIPITGGTGVTIYYSALGEGGTRGGAGTNQTRTITKGILYLTQLSGQDVASLGFSIDAIWDGTNQPIQSGTAANLPSGSAGAATKYRLAQVVDDDSVAIVFHKLRNYSIDFNVRPFLAQVGNNVYSVDAAIESFEPTARWETMACKIGLDASAYSGKLVPTGGLDFYIAPLDDDGIGHLAAGCVMLTFRAGSMYCPTRVNWPERGAASVEYQAWGKGGDALTEPPIAYATAQTLAAETSTSGLWMSGPVKDNTTAIEIGRATFTPQIAVESFRPATLLWPNSMSIMRREPMFEAELLSLDYAEGVEDSEGQEIVADSWFFYLRKMTESGAQKADATAEHIKFTFHKGRIEIVEAPGQHLQISRPSMKVTAVHNGTSIFSLNTASAIS